MSPSVHVSSGPWLDAMPDRIAAPVQDWLQHPGSLSARLRGLGHFSVTVVREGTDCAGDDEAGALALSPGGAIWRRDVMLLVDDEPVVVARSSTPFAESWSAWAALRALGRQPLADILYDDPQVARSPIQFRALRPADPLFGQATDAVPALIAPRLWARRSVFLRRGAPLAVAECFLPTLWARVGVDLP